MDKVLDDIRAERAYQDKTWGGSGFDDTQSEAEGRAAGRDFRTRMVKAAALAVAAIEAHDRKAAKGA